MVRVITGPPPRHSDTDPIAPVDLAPGASLHEPVCDPGPRRAPTTAHRARTERQRRVFVLGFHPVGNPHDVVLRLHPDAPPAHDRAAPGPRCGTCAHRRLSTDRYKCGCAPHAWVPGRGVDVPAWWPACAHWRPAPDPTPAAEAAGPAAGRSGAQDARV